MDKSERREAKRFKDKHRPRGNPKFLHLLVQEEVKRLERAIARIEAARREIARM